MDDWDRRMNIFVDFVNENRSEWGPIDSGYDMD